MVNITWTDTAKASLKLIFDFYLEIAGRAVAEKIRDKIFADTQALQNATFSTEKEPNLKNFEKDYRYLVSGNFKIIYFRENAGVIISLVFDARQNPNKMEELLIV